METFLTLENEKIKFLESEKLSSLLSLKISGEIKNIFYPKDDNQLITLIKYFAVNELKFCLIANGTNLLISPKNDINCFICLKDMKKTIKKYKNYVTFSSSISLGEAFAFCYKNSLSGFEQLALIPGSIGGAVKINAGCFGREIFDKLTQITVFKEGKIQVLEKNKIDFGYRKTNLENEIILSAKFKLDKTEKSFIKDEYMFYAKHRVEKQPKGFSCGSVFKNPSDFSAGYLIEKCGLKGLTYNGACISEKHANFILNENNASFDDIIYLINLCKKSVKEKFDITLVPEIKIID